MGLSDFFSSLLPTVHAEEPKKDEDESSGDAEGSDSKEEGEDAEEGGEEEEEEEEEPQDPADQIREQCENSYNCRKLKHHFDHCNERVESKKDLVIEGEDCTEELFHLLHCVDTCAAPKIWKKLV